MLAFLGDSADLFAGVRYTYDKLDRLVREDNKQLGKTVLYSYDNNGNILSKREFAFTLKDTGLLEELDSADILYSYDDDRLLSYGNESFDYDELGNPELFVILANKAVELIVSVSCREFPVLQYLGYIAALVILILTVVQKI